MFSPEFHGMITNIEENVGCLLARVKQLVLVDNMIIIFWGDNGTSGGVKTNSQDFLQKDDNKGYNAGLRGQKDSVYEGVHRQPLIMIFPGRVPLVVSTLTCVADLMPTFVRLYNLRLLRTIDFDEQDMFMADSKRFVVVDT